MCHLPALAGGGPFRLITLVDHELTNAVAAAACFRDLGGEPIGVTAQLDDILPTIDAAIVATPADSHAHIAATLLRAGVHVLVEKPLAITVAECERMRTAIVAGGAVAVPAHVRRLYRSTEWVRSVLDSGRLGEILRVRWHQGRAFGWPLVSAHTVDPGRRGAGVLADLGPHVFDLLRSWFGEPTRVTAFRDNADGDVASEIALELAVGDVRAEVQLSWLRTLSNRCVIEGERRTLSVGLGHSPEYDEFASTGALIDSGPVPANGPADAGGLQARFRQQLAEFARAVERLPTQLATFDDGVATISLIESCAQSRRTRLPRPWRDTSRARGSGGATRAAVTGATGFVGASVVERLVTNHAGTVVVAVGRSFSRLARLSHLDGARLRYARVDLRDRPGLTSTFSGCDAVVHTAYGSSGTPAQRWAVTVDGTAAALSAAADSGVSRFVHISSMAVYDMRHVALLDESCPTLAAVAGDCSYAQQKLAAERLVVQAAGGRMEVVSLQPAIVYGPWGPNWTLRALAHLRSGVDELPSGPEGGVCNAVHVHDVADAAVFLTTAAGIDGRRLLVAGPDSVPWGTFYDAYRELLNVPRGYSYDWTRAPELYLSPVIVDSARLRALGFEPRLAFSDGMAQVAAWARWAGLDRPATGADEPASAE